MIRRRIAELLGPPGDWNAATSRPSVWNRAHRERWAEAALGRIFPPARRMIDGLMLAVLAAGLVAICASVFGRQLLALMP